MAGKLDDEVIDQAVRCGLYQNREELLEDIVSDRNRDEFASIAVAHNLRSQITEKLYGDITKFTGAAWAGDFETEHRLSIVVLIGQGTLGTVVGPRNRTAEFEVRRGSDGLWLRFWGSRTRSRTPLNNLAHTLSRHHTDMARKQAESSGEGDTAITVSVTPKKIRGVTRAVLQCISLADSSWVSIKKFPINCANFEHERIAEFLRGTPYGTYEKAEGIQATTGQ
jgi:hypothetical protein